MAFNKEHNLSNAVLELMILKDMEEWLQEKQLDGQDMHDYLDYIESTEGEKARSKKLAMLTETYWYNHLLTI